jgi:hypothetical protein
MDTNPKFPRNIHTNRRKKGICMDILLFYISVLYPGEKFSWGEEAPQVLDQGA